MDFICKGSRNFREPLLPEDGENRAEHQNLREKQTLTIGSRNGYNFII